MKYFKASGLWFLGDAPQNRVAGTLTYSEHGLSLRLLGGLRGGWSPRIEPYPLIHGVVSKNPYGEFVTLIDCFTKRTRLSSAGIGSETIHCNRGIAGDAHLRPEFDQFQALEVGISYLSDWFGRKGVATEFVPGDRLGLDIRYRKPETTEWPLDQAVLKLGTAARSTEAFHKFEITEVARLFIEPLPRLTAEQVHGEYVRPLQNLMSFATDTPNEVDGVELRGEKVNHGEFERNRSYHLLHNPIFRLKRKKDRLTNEDMLFDFDEVLGSGLNIFERWFGFTRKHEAFCTVYFASLYAPPKYLDEKFLRLMSAFTLLTSSLGEVDHRTAGFLDDVNKLVANRFTEEERALIGPILPIGPEIEMPARLLGLLREYEPILKQIVGDDPAGFVRSVSVTLSFVERRIAVGNHPPIQGDNLYYAMEKISTLIKILVMRELGFGEEQVARSIERNKHFVHMKSMWPGP